MLTVQSDFDLSRTNTIGLKCFLARTGRSDLMERLGAWVREGWVEKWPTCPCVCLFKCVPVFHLVRLSWGSVRLSHVQASNTTLKFRCALWVAVSRSSSCCLVSYKSHVTDVRPAPLAGLHFLFSVLDTPFATSSFCARSEYVHSFPSLFQTPVLYITDYKL